MDIFLSVILMDQLYIRIAYYEKNDSGTYVSKASPFLDSSFGRRGRVALAFVELVNADNGGGTSHGSCLS